MCGPLWRFSPRCCFLVSSSLCSFMFIVELILVAWELFNFFGFYFFFYLFSTFHNGFEYPYTHVFFYRSLLLAVHKKYCYNKLLVFLDKFWICTRYCPRHYACERGPSNTLWVISRISGLWLMRGAWDFALGALMSMRFALGTWFGALGAWKATFSSDSGCPMSKAHLSFACNQAYK